MHTKLTLRIDEELIERAKSHARQSGKSVSQLVSDYLRMLPQPERTRPRPPTPIVESLCGVLASSGLDEGDYRQHPEANWSPGFFERLSAVDFEIAAAVDELAPMRQERKSKLEPRGDSLLILPIHKQTEEKYDQEWEKHLTAERKKLEDLWHRSFEQLPTSTKLYMENEWRYLPWYYNSIVGFLAIESTGGRDLKADIYLKRRHFPRQHQEHKWDRPIQGEQILYYGDVKLPVERADNSAYIEPIHKLISLAERWIRSSGCGLRMARVFCPSYGLDCLNLAEIHRRVDGEAPCLIGTMAL